MRHTTKLAMLATSVLLAAAPASAERIFGLTPGKTIVTFNSTAPGVITSTGAIAGLGNDTLLGLDLRPSNRQLYSLASSGNLYIILKDGVGTGYTASLIGNIGVPITGNRYGIDFNPVPDRLRFVTDTDQNLRINPNTAVTIVDGTVTAVGAESLAGAAYTNNRPGALSTVLYAIDAAGGGKLVRSTNPNAGTYVDVGALGVTIPGGNNVGFDISGSTGLAYMNISRRFYTVNLVTGAATFVSNLGVNSLTGLTAGAVPEPASWALMIVGFGLVGVGMRRRGPARVTA